MIVASTSLPSYAEINRAHALATDTELDIAIDGLEREALRGAPKKKLKSYVDGARRGYLTLTL